MIHLLLFGLAARTAKCIPAAPNRALLRRGGTTTTSADGTMDVAADVEAESLLEVNLALAAGTDLGEADRLWSQFNVLDTRFAHVARLYMDAARHQQVIEAQQASNTKLGGADKKASIVHAEIKADPKKFKAKAATVESKQQAKAKKNSPLVKDGSSSQQQTSAKSNPGHASANKERGTLGHDSKGAKQHATHKAHDKSNKRDSKEAPREAKALELGGTSTELKPRKILDHREGTNNTNFLVSNVGHKESSGVKSGTERRTTKDQKQNSVMSDPTPAVTYGFYLHVFFEANAVVHQLRSVRKFYPEAPVYIMSDGGANFSGICKKIDNCLFAWRAPAHDCWNPKPFLDRFHEAATWLASKHAEWTIFLEPDVTLNKRATFPLRKGVVAGGLYDTWNPKLPIKLRHRVEEVGRNFSANRKFSISWDHFGLAGGSIILTKAAIVSFKPDTINWPEMEKLGGDTVYSSDIAMLVALGSHGFDYYPWDDVSQGHDEFQPMHETAFQHHNSGEKGGKPLYGVRLAKEDEHLVGPPPNGIRPIKIGQCQHCIWANEEECWQQHGVIECPVDQVQFRYRSYRTESPQPELFNAIKV